MVCVDLIGRMCNNFFQIACAVGYAEKYHVEYYIPEWKYSDCFKTKFTKYSAGDVFYGEKSFYNYEEIPFIENVKLFGFWQSEKYFKHCESKIRELFQFNDTIKEHINKKYEIKDNTCSIHVRRGDYIGSGLYEVCNLKYYNDAIDEIKSRINVTQFVVFSDDISWCKSSFPADFIFVEGNSDIEDLYFMTQCTHNIISNSSFSWWGAWLNSNDNKIVISPDRWYNSEVKTDVILDNWIKIKTRN